MYLILLALLAVLGVQTRPALTETPRWPSSWPIRRHPRVAHLMPYLRGDSLRAVRFAARVLRRRFIDQNGQEDAEGIVWILHWGDLRKGGYRWHWTGEHDSRGREIRKRIPRGTMVDDCTTAYMSRVRSRKYGGRRPHTAEEHMHEWVRYHVTGCLEGKGTLRSRRAFEYIAGAAVRTGATVVFMRLQSIPGWREAFEHGHEVGLPLAILPRGPKPHDWSRFAALGVQVWGRWR